MKNIYNNTIRACFAGFAVQAIVNNFVPLLFLTFQTTYNIPLSQITLLITVNFVFQLLTDLLSALFVDKIGYRASALIAHGCVALGLASLTVLPELFGNAFIGLLISVIIYAVGGGLLEVIVSPIVEACPTEHKEKAMSLLHSSYCWGSLAVVGLSTIFFSLFGTAHWKTAALLWMVLPIVNGIIFIKVPIPSIVPEDVKGLSLKELFKVNVFWIFMLLMMCAGACEMAVAQWASTFAEKGLGVTKEIGDLAGPAFFAICMGTVRTLYGKFGEKVNLKYFMFLSGVLCCVSYLIISLSPYAWLGFLGCGLCGFSVGIMWPGTFSISSAVIKGGGTPMFALLALAGDLGCGSGPTFVGIVSSTFNDNLKKGILAAIVFPIILIIGLLLVKNYKISTKPEY